MNETVNTKATELADFCVKCAEDKLAEDVLKLYVAPQTTIADYFVICTANSEPQMRAVCGFIERAVRDEFKVRSNVHENEPASGWLLLDFGTVLVHVMTPEVRDRYSLESLWRNSDLSGAAVKTLESMSERN